MNFIASLMCVMSCDTTLKGSL